MGSIGGFPMSGMRGPGLMGEGCNDPARVEIPPVAKRPKLKAKMNPIAKLYEYSSKIGCPQPVFETIKTERKTHKEYTKTKTEFTIQCKIKDKVFTGTAFLTKGAKLKAAEEAWAAVQAGRC